MSTIYVKVTLAIILAASFLGAPQSARSTDAMIIETNLCAILNNPEAFHGKLVEIGAYAKTSMHATFLYHSTFSKKGIALSVPNELEHAARELFFESFRPEVFNGEYLVWANFTGRIEWRPGKQPAIILSLVEISDLKSASREAVPTR